MLGSEKIFSILQKSKIKKDGMTQAAIPSFFYSNIIFSM